MHHLLADDPVIATTPKHATSSLNVCIKQEDDADELDSQTTETRISFLLSLAL